MNKTLDYIAEELLEFPGEVDREQCQLLGPLALAIQALMGVVVIGSLVLKRAREQPKRPWKIWLADVSKQIIGQAFIHGSNLLISDLIAHHSSRSNPCTLYFLNIMVDTTLGVFVLYLFLKLINWILINRLAIDHLQSGEYGDPPRFMPWLKQLTVYLLALTLMKICVVALFQLWRGMYKVGDWLLGWLSDSVDAQIVFTMCIVPICMNVLQFLIIDSIIKGYKNNFELLPTDEESGPILQADDDNLESTTADSEVANSKYLIKTDEDPEAVPRLSTDSRRSLAEDARSKIKTI